MRVVCEFFGFNPSHDGKRENVEVSVVWLAQLGAWVASVVKCLTEQETHGN